MLNTKYYRIDIERGVILETKMKTPLTSRKKAKDFFLNTQRRVKGGRYWYKLSDGSVLENIDMHNAYDNINYSTGNYYLKKEEVPE